MLNINLTILNQIVAHAIQNYPSEACGLLIGKAHDETVTEFLPVKNLYDEMRARYPESYPRTSKTAYLIDPREQQRIFDEVASRGLTVKSIYHSHTDHDSYFSDEDRLVAAPWGEPSFPGISFVVVSIHDGKFRELSDYVWHESEKSFVKRPITIS